MSNREQLAHNPNNKGHKSNYRSVIAQTLHYMSRPHSGIAQQPVHSKAAWRSSELLKADQDWQQTLTEEDIAELDQALQHTKIFGQADRCFKEKRLSTTDFEQKNCSMAHRT